MSADALREVARLPFVETLADFGLPEAIKRQPALISGINILGGRVACKGVAEAHGLVYAPVSS